MDKEECIRIFKDEIMKSYNDGEYKYMINKFKFDDLDLNCHIYFYNDYYNSLDEEDEVMCFTLYFFVYEKDILADSNLLLELNQMKKLYNKEFFQAENENAENIIENILRFILYDFRSKYVYSKVIDEIVLMEDKDLLEKKKMAEYLLVDNYSMESCCVCTESNIYYTKCKHNVCRVCKITINNGINKCCPICRNIFF
jgi:hypothetical protein